MADLKVISPGVCAVKCTFSIKSLFPWGRIVLLATEFLWTAPSNVNIINHKQGNFGPVQTSHLLLRETRQHEQSYEP